MLSLSRDGMVVGFTGKSTFGQKMYAYLYVWANFTFGSIFITLFCLIIKGGGGLRGCDHMMFRSKTTYAISACHL